MFSTNLSLVSRPRTDWRFSARFRRYDYNNNSRHAAIPEFINYDTSVKVRPPEGPSRTRTAAALSMPMRRGAG